MARTGDVPRGSRHHLIGKPVHLLRIEEKNVLARRGKLAGPCLHLLETPIGVFSDQGNPLAVAGRDKVNRNAEGLVPAPLSLASLCVMEDQHMPFVLLLRPSYFPLRF